jgi:glucosamine-6-phosphate deaminase
MATLKPIFETKNDSLLISIYPTNKDMGMAAAQEAADTMREAMRARGKANIILATGNSQISFLEALSAHQDLDWSCVNVFHMDEYVGIPADHPASFPLFLRLHLIDKVKPRSFYPIVGQTGNLEETCRRYEQLLRQNPADLCILGIGENGHLAFNDPPLARFDETKWVHVVTLAESCKRQQVGEGHFQSIEAVPGQAISLSIPALLAARRVLAIVPESRKADIVAQTLRGPISPLIPASILRQTAHAHLYLDLDSAARVLA